MSCPKLIKAIGSQHGNKTPLKWTHQKLSFSGHSLGFRSTVQLVINGLYSVGLFLLLEVDQVSTAFINTTIRV